MWELCYNFYLNVLHISRIFFFCAIFIFFHIKFQSDLVLLLILSGIFFHVHLKKKFLQLLLANKYTILVKK